MLGAIVGDIVGSVYEFMPHKSKIFPLFSEHSVFTDDTVMTLAVAEALMNGETEANYTYSIQKRRDNISIAALAPYLALGFFKKIPDPTTASAMERLCACLRLRGSITRWKMRKTLRQSASA